MATMRLFFLALAAATSAATNTTSTNVTSTNESNATSTAPSPLGPAPPANVTSTNGTSTNATVNATSTNSTTTANKTDSSDASSVVTVVDPSSPGTSVDPSSPGTSVVIMNSTSSNVTESAPPSNVTTSNGTSTKVVPPEFLKCTSDAMCRVHGDAAAQCMTGKCLCTAGYRVLEGYLEQCISVEADPATLLVRLFFSLRFGNGNFSALTDEVKTGCVGVIDGVLGKLQGAAKFSEGSIVMDGAADVAAADAATKGEPAALQAAVAAKVKDDAALANVLGSEVTAVVLVESSCDVATHPGAKTMIPFPAGSCTVTECLVTHDYNAVDAKCVEKTAVTPEPTTGTPEPKTARGVSGGDDSNGGVIAGAVIGSIAGVAIIGGVGYFLMKRNADAKKQSNANSNPIETEFTFTADQDPTRGTDDRL